MKRLSLMFVFVLGFGVVVAFGAFMIALVNVVAGVVEGGL